MLRFMNLFHFVVTNNGAAVKCDMNPIYTTFERFVLVSLGRSPTDCRLQRSVLFLEMEFFFCLSSMRLWVIPVVLQSLFSALRSSEIEQIEWLQTSCFLYYSGVYKSLFRCVVSIWWNTFEESNLTHVCLLAAVAKDFWVKTNEIYTNVLKVKNSWQGNLRSQDPSSPSRSLPRVAKQHKVILCNKRRKKKRLRTGFFFCFVFKNSLVVCFNCENLQILKILR